MEAVLKRSGHNSSRSEIRSRKEVDSQTLSRAGCWSEEEGRREPSGGRKERERTRERKVLRFLRSLAGPTVLPTLYANYVELSGWLLYHSCTIFYFPTSPLQTQRGVQGLYLVLLSCKPRKHPSLPLCGNFSFPGSTAQHVSDDGPSLLARK